MRHLHFEVINKVFKVYGFLDSLTALAKKRAGFGTRLCQQRTKFYFVY